MSWLLLALASACLLGVYDYFKKLALNDNAVLPVLFLSVATGATVWAPFIIWGAINPTHLPPQLNVSAVSDKEHLLLLAKATLVAASWLCGYFGIKSLPLSIATPIRATAPLWTIAFAILFFGESPTPRQWIGVTTIIIAFFSFSLVGRHEGIRFHRDKGVILIIGATLLGASSALYDKYLLQTANIIPTCVQAWFTLYTALLLLPILIYWRKNPNRHAFHWHWAIPMIGITLIVADLLYFTAIAQPDALISLISPVRRTSVIVSFLLGIFLFREKHLVPKALCILGIIAGVILLS